MNREQIINAIKSLANSQGFYGRLYEAITSGTEEAEEYLDLLESKDFSDVVDLVLYIEG